MGIGQTDQVILDFERISLAKPQGKRARHDERPVIYGTKAIGDGRAPQVNGEYRKESSSSGDGSSRSPIANSAEH